MAFRRRLQNSWGRQNDSQDPYLHGKEQALRWLV
jgi:hypothetical protein